MIEKDRGDYIYIPYTTTPDYTRKIMGGTARNCSYGSDPCLAYAKITGATVRNLQIAGCVSTILTCPPVVREFELISIPSFRVGEDQLLTIIAVKQAGKLAHYLAPSVSYDIEEYSISA